MSSTITQIVEIRNSEDERFARLLELLSEHDEQGKVLVFVNSQDKCTSLFQQLLNYGYPNQPLHGDMQQVRLPVPTLAAVSVLSHHCMFPAQQHALPPPDLVVTLADGPRKHDQ